MIKPLPLYTLTIYAFFSLTLSTSALANTAPNVPDISNDPDVHNNPDVSNDSDLNNDVNNDTNVNDDSISRHKPKAIFEPTGEEWGWTDEKREDVKEQLNDWAHEMDDWFGEPNPKKPATASLRVVLDTRWADDPIEGTEVRLEPRIRGRLKLPVLEQRLSLIIGDEDLDDDTFLRQGSGAQNTFSTDDRLLNTRKARDDNASIALRWSRFEKTVEEELGIRTDVDVGIRSLDDLYVKVSVDKDWYESKKLTINSDNFYRYGLDSQHYVRGELGFKYLTGNRRFLDNRITLRYRNKDDEESTDWSNDLRQVHYLGNDKELAYGASVSGYFDSDKETLNSYGPSISYRQPIWREWLFMQTELNYYNDKTEDKSHYPSALLRMEALF